MKKRKEEEFWVEAFEENPSPDYPIFKPPILSGFQNAAGSGRRLLPIPVSRTLLAFEADIWFSELDAEPSARLSEEPCAGKPHAGICEGGAR